MISNSIFIKRKDRYVKINLIDVLWVEANGSSVSIFVQKNPNENRVKFVQSVNLKTFSKQVRNQNFLRIHRSFLVNPEKVEAINGRQLVIDGMMIPFSKQFKDVIDSEFPILRT